MQVKVCFIKQSFISYQSRLFETILEETYDTNF